MKWRGFKLHLIDLPKLIVRRRSSAILGVVIIVMLWAGVFLIYVFMIGMLLLRPNGIVPKEGLA